MQYRDSNYCPRLHKKKRKSLPYASMCRQSTLMRQTMKKYEKEKLYFSLLFDYFLFVFLLFSDLFCCCYIRFHLFAIFVVMFKAISESEINDSQNNLTFAHFSIFVALSLFLSLLCFWGAVSTND